MDRVDVCSASTATPFAKRLWTWWTIWTSRRDADDYVARASGRCTHCINKTRSIRTTRSTRSRLFLRFHCKAGSATPQLVYASALRVAGEDRRDTTSGAARSWPRFRILTRPGQTTHTPLLARINGPRRTVVRAYRLRTSSTQAHVCVARVTMRSRSDGRHLTSRRPSLDVVNLRLTDEAT
jgi:hypothetical protein